MSDARISCTNSQLVAGGFTVVVGVAVTAMIARLFKERVATVVAVGLSASLVAGSVVAMQAAPKEVIEPEPRPNPNPPPPPSFPTDRSQVRAWVKAQEGSLKDAFESSTESVAKKTKVIGWMEEVERRDLLKQLDVSSPILQAYFHAGHDADLLAWVKATLSKQPDAVSELGSEAIKVVVKAPRTESGLRYDDVKSLIGKLGAEAPEVAEHVPDESMRIFEMSAVEAYCGAAGTDVSEYWKDEGLRDSVLMGLFGRDDQTGIDYLEMLKKRSDNELRGLFQALDRWTKPSDEFCQALKERLKDPVGLTKEDLKLLNSYEKLRNLTRWEDWKLVEDLRACDVSEQELDVVDLQLFLFKHVDGFFSFKEYFLFMSRDTRSGRQDHLANAAFARVKASAKFKDLLPEEGAFQLLKRILKKEADDMRKYSGTHSELVKAVFNAVVTDTNGEQLSDWVGAEI